MPRKRLFHCCRHVRALLAWCRTRLDQRFASEEEAKYRKSLEHHFYVPCYFGAAMTAYLSASSTYQTYLKLMDFCDPSEAFFLVMVGSRLAISLSAMTMILACVLKRMRCCPSVNLEGAFLAWTVFIQTNTMWFNVWHGSKLFGKDPRIVFPDWDAPGAEGAALLVLSTIVMGNLIAPVRTHVSWIIPFSGWLSYNVLTVVCGSASPAYFTSNIGSLSVLLPCTLYGSYHHEVHLRREWRAQLKVGTQQDLLESQYHGVCRILNLLCDCTIRLGSNLEFLEPNTRFAAMLMKSDGKTLLGTRMCDYIPDVADKERVDAMVAGKQTSEGESVEADTSTSGMFHIKFKDSMGADFPVDIYHTRIANGENIEYLVGIVENRAREPAPAEGSPHFFYGSSATPESNIIGFTPDAGRRPTSRSSRSSSGDAQSTGSSLKSSSKDSNLGEVAVNILADPDAGFPIVSCTPGFTVLSGPITEMEQLSKFIEDLGVWKRKIQNMLNVFYNSCQNVEIDAIMFRKQNSSIEYLINGVNLELAEIRASDNHSGSDSSIIIRAAFHGIHQRRHSKRRRKTRHQSVQL